MGVLIREYIGIILRNSHIILTILGHLKLHKQTLHPRAFSKPLDECPSESTQAQQFAKVAGPDSFTHKANACRRHGFRVKTPKPEPLNRMQR